MAISRERLEELIKNCELIYGIEFNKIESYDLSDKDICISPAEFGDYGLRVFDPLGYWNDIKYENLFETKEDAEWAVEFENITKPNKLNFPKWKQIEDLIEQKKNFGLNHSDTVLARIITNDSIYYFKLCKDLDLFTFELKQLYIGEDLCEQLTSKFPVSLGKATKENYIDACRIVRKLFMGDERDE